MTDRPTPLPPDPPPTTPPGPSRRWDWRPKLRWFAAEIIVVVAGVLIALALNAWWAERTQQRALREALVAVEEDFRATKVEMDRVMTANRAYVAVVEAYLQLGPDQGEALPADSVATLTNQLFLGGLTFDPTVGAVEALVSGGGVSLIEDVALRTHIAAWPSMMDELAEDHEILIDMYMAQQERMVQIGLYAEAWQADLAGEWEGGEGRQRALLQTLADEELLNRLAAHMSAIIGLRDELEVVESHLDRTLVLLNRSLHSR